MKSMLPAWLRTTALIMVVVMGVNAISSNAYGAIVTSQPVTMASVRAEDMAAVQKILEQKVVQHRLQALGFTQEEVNQRLQRASDQDLHQLVVQANTLTAGGDGGSVLTVVLIVLVVLIIIRLIRRPAAVIVT